LKFSVHVRCPHGAQCPDLWRKDKTWRSSHGSAGFALRLPTSAGGRPIKRFGYPSKTAARDAAEQVGKLLDLAPDDPDLAAEPAG
jgi:hypothetical protein